MARPRKMRRCQRYQTDHIYEPHGELSRNIDTTILTLDQLEAIRLCDIENLDQEQAGQLIGVSRGTIQRLLYSAGKRIVEAILHNNTFIINLKKSEDGHVSLHTHHRQFRAGRYSK